MDLISIIIPMYNSGKTLKGLLSSVIHQTYQNYEVILIDDGSSDDTKKICNQYKNIDKRFKYYYKENEGVSIARNMGIDLANGDYITFIDSDDLIDEKYLEVLLNLAKSNDVDIVICNVLKECDGEIIDSFTMQDCIINIKEAFELLFTRKKINSGPCAKLFKSRIIKNIKFPKMTAYEDIIFIKDVFEKAKSIYVTNKISYHYIEQKGSAMHKFLKEPTEDIINVTDDILDFILTSKYELSDETFYITSSHLMQYVQSVFNIRNENYKMKMFILKSKDLYKKYRKEIFKCKAFSWKEKIIYILFSYGFLIEKKRVKCI